MVAHVCISCNFRFEAKYSGDCPYCGRDTIEKDKSASELLEEIEDLLRK